MRINRFLLLLTTLLCSQPLLADPIEVKSRIDGFGSLEPALAVVEPGETLHLLIKPEPGHRLRQISGCNGQYQAGIFVVENPRYSCVVAASFVPDGAQLVSPAPAQTAASSAIQQTQNAGMQASTRTSTAQKAGRMLKFILVANQVMQQVSVTSRVIAGLGTVLPAVQQLQKNQPATVTATPAAGYAIQSISGCGQQSATSPLLIPAVSANCVVDVVFVQLKNALWDQFNWDQATWG